MYNLIHGDSILEMQKMKYGSIDICITDPPYGLKYLEGEFSDFNNTTNSGGIFKGTKRGGTSFSKEQNKELYEFIYPFFLKIYKVLKPGSFCIVFSQGRLLLGMMQALEYANFEIREVCYWKKPSAKPNQQKPKGELKNYNDEVIYGPGKVIEPFIIAQCSKEGTYAENWNKYGVGLVDSDLLTTTFFEYASNKEKIEHPTVKPRDLMIHLVQGFSKKGDIVLDPFNGSGTTGVAALMCERDYIGIELNEKFYKESQQRLKKIKSLIF